MTEIFVPGSRAQLSIRERILTVFSYLWLLAIIPLMLEWKSRVVMWHARQGLLLAALDSLAFFGLLQAGIPRTHSGLAVDLYGLAFLSAILLLPALHLACIVEGVTGNRITVPLLGRFAGRLMKAT
jgi:uncharacterized membrane protein